MNDHAQVDALYITKSAGEPMRAVERVKSVADRGLVGDRYYRGTGFYSNKEGWGANVTLIQSEAIAAVNTGYQTDFSGAMLRRNIVTSNVKLESLIGFEFRCGTSVLYGTKPFPPCAHLAFLLGRHEVLKYFAYCGGIGARVVVAGEIRVGDQIRRIDVESTTD